MNIGEITVSLSGTAAQIDRLIDLLESIEDSIPNYDADGHKNIAEIRTLLVAMIAAHVGDAA